MVVLDVRPREERDFRELHAGLDDSVALPVIVSVADESPSPHELPRVTIPITQRLVTYHRPFDDPAIVESSVSLNMSSTAGSVAKEPTILDKLSEIKEKRPTKSKSGRGTKRERLTKEEQTATETFVSEGSARGSRSRSAQELPLPNLDQPSAKQERESPRKIAKHGQSTDSAPVQTSRTDRSEGSESRPKPQNDDSPSAGEEIAAAGSTSHDKLSVDLSDASYDMDEQDMAFMAHLVAKGHKISPLQFERAILVLERGWLQIERRMERRGESNPRADDDVFGLDDGRMFGCAASEQRCAVCHGDELDPGNAIVFCDGCNVAVHQECYGIAFIPKDAWFCRHCMLRRGRRGLCVFCPLQTGAFKQLDDGRWSHVVCALWIPEVYFASPVYMEPIEGFSRIPRTRWRLVCYICRRRHGACVQCTLRLCVLAYHVTCAKRAGLYMAMQNGVAGALSLKASLLLFCDRHSPPHWLQAAVHDGIRRTRAFFSQSTRNRHRGMFRWRTENGAPIAPHGLAHLVRQSLEEGVTQVTQVSKQRVNGWSTDQGQSERLTRSHVTKTDGVSESHATFAKIEDDACASFLSTEAQICRYWLLKREQRTPLITQPQAISSPGPDATAFGQTLLVDLRKLAQLAQLVWRRQRLLCAETNMTLAMAETAYFPTKSAGGALAKEDEEERRVRIPFVKSHGLHFSPTPHDAKAILEEEDLSEVETAHEAD